MNGEPLGVSLCMWLVCVCVWLYEEKDMEYDGEPLRVSLCLWLCVYIL